MRSQREMIEPLLILILTVGLVAPLAAQSPAIVLTDQTAAQGLNGYVFVAESFHGLGLNWIDFNNDGWDDLFAVNGMDGTTNMPYHLFRNDGGTFTNVDELLPPDPAIEMMGSVFADYDNDGDQDIYIYVAVPVQGTKKGNGSPPNQLLRNLWVENGHQVIPGEPLFEEVAAAAGVDDLLPSPLPDGPSYVSVSANWLDYDRDGYVDLYVGHWNEGNNSPWVQDRLFRNLGNGQFEDVSTQVGLDLIIRDALVTIAGHLNSDLWPDVYVGNITPQDQDQIFENQNGTGFLDVAGDSLGVGNDSRFAMGLTIGDIDLDGDFDVYVTDWEPLNSCGGTNALYENLGGASILFADDSACDRGIASAKSWGANFVDVDSDGYEDLFVSRIASGSNDLFRNNGDGTFTKVGIPSRSGSQGRGSAIADYDRDGDVDIIVVQHGRTVQLLRNDTAPTNNWVQFDLQGAGTPGASNRSAIGALVRVTAGGNQYVRQVLGGSSAHSQDSLRLSFGLGDAAVVDLVEVFWPSGLVDTSLVGVAVNQVYTVQEVAELPVVTIVQPSQGALFMAGDLIDFEGSADDPDEGDLSSDLTWTSSLDGAIGSGGSFSAVLSEGAHVILASVTDIDGNVGQAAVNLVVTPAGGFPPTVTITSPADGSTSTTGTLIDFAGTASDTEDGNLAGSILWTSDRDGDLGIGGNLSVSLTEGTHEITASVVDGDGNLAEDSVIIDVTVPTGETIEKTLLSIGTEDGRVFESSEDSGVGGVFNQSLSGGGAIRIGDDNEDRQTVAVFSFDTSVLPAGAVIESAVLRIQRGGSGGSDPFTTHGTAYVDVKTGGFSGNPALQASDFQAAADAPRAAVLSSASANGDWSEATLDLLGLSAISRTGTTQMRVYFEIDDDDDNLTDFVSYYPGEAADSASRPQLVVSYFAVETEGSVARQWNEEILGGIRRDFARPTVHARNLYHTSVAMWDAWAAYDSTANTILHHEKATAADVQAAREEAISYAAYRLASWRFADSPGAGVTLPSLDNRMDVLGYDRNVTTTVGDTPAALGNRIAATIIAYGLADYSNEVGGYENLSYEPINPPLLPDFTGNPDLIDPNRWQPLALDFFEDQSGNIIVGGFPEALSPEWGIVEAFSLSTDDLTIYNRDGFDYWVYHDPGPPPTLDTEAYKVGFEQVLEWSGLLDPADGVMIDISPASRGNNTLGTNDGTGRDLNPVTGEPYAPEIVPAADYYRVLAEFWADGPASETPPGHWFTIANYVSDHPLVVKQLGGVGPVLDDLEWDVKVYTVLGGTMHDVAVAAWGVKGWYDYIRPVSAIRHMCDLGQRTDLSDPSYHPNGIALDPGRVEIITEVTTAPGGIHEHLAGLGGENIGKIAARAWRGPDYISDPDVDTAGVGWILCGDWWPYQRPSFVTPPFPGYVSGHSTFSRAAAEVMTLLTGTEYFPGGLGEFEAPQNEFLVFEEGPSVDVTLQWATYQDASDETSLSRIYGGIHPTADDIPGRLMGYAIGPEAFDHALSYFEGTAAPVVTIGAPTDGEPFDAGELIAFLGSANDAKDGDVTASLAWESSLDGAIGTGGSFSAALSEGSHLITATATDADGNVNVDSISLVVGPAGGVQEMILYSIGADDGTVFESSEDSNVGGVISQGPAVRIGDDGLDKQIKAIFSFDTSLLPEGAVIEMATLRIRRGPQFGGNPFLALGACHVDVQTGGFSGNPALQPSDFESPATVTQSATLSGAPNIRDWSEGTLDSAGLAAIDPTGITQMRVYFELDDDDDEANDAFGYYSGETPSSANYPELVVTYTLP